MTASPPRTQPGSAPVVWSGVDFGRSQRREVRNPVLRLPAAQAIVGLPLEQRRPLGVLLRELANQANDQAEISWSQKKGIMAAYWKAVSVYAKHLARVIDPISARVATPIPSQHNQTEA